MKHKIWQKHIDKNELAAYRSNFQVISSHVSEGKLVIHVFADSRPDGGFDPIEGGLEDVYFSTITKN